LRAKLFDAGYKKDDIDLTEREDLLTLYAELLVETQARVSVSEPPATAMDDNLSPDGHVVVNVDKEMFEFEKRKWEAEERYREPEMEKWKANRKHAKLNRKRVKLRWKSTGLKKNSVTRNGKLSGKTAKLSYRSAGLHGKLRKGINCRADVSRTDVSRTSYTKEFLCTKRV